MQVLLWTFVLLASCSAPANGRNYLIRETVSSGRGNALRDDQPGSARPHCAPSRPDTQQTLKLATRTGVRAVVYHAPLRAPKLLWRFEQSEQRSASVRAAEHAATNLRAEKAGTGSALRGLTKVRRGSLPRLPALGFLFHRSAVPDRANAPHVRRL